MIRKMFGIATLCLAAFLGVSAGDYSIAQLKLNHNDALYKCGEEVVVTGKLLKGEKPVAEGKLRVITKWEGFEVAMQDIPCDGGPFKVTYKSTKPGWVCFAFMVLDANGRIVERPAAELLQRKKLPVGEIGAIYEPEKIRTRVRLPADFTEYWQDVRAKLDKVPFNAKLEKLDAKDPKIELYALSVDAGTDRPVTAYLACPAGAKQKSLPAVVDFLSWSSRDASRARAIANAGRGMIALAATWHGLPVNRPADFYRKTLPKVFRADRNIGDRDKWELRGVYLRVLRALDYIKSRPEWDGKTLVVQGESLGGAQAAAAAAFDPAVTAAIVVVPCFCEFGGDLAGRKRSIPVAGFKPEQLTPEVRSALDYFDVANLATRIKCEVVFCTGYTDELCPPSNVIAAYNNLPAGTPKEFCGDPLTGHYGTMKNVKSSLRFKDIFGNIKVNPFSEKK